jgi:pyridoxamine 5'-phosphate oxidase
VKRQADFADLRRDYSRRGIDREDLDADPFRQFGNWFGDAKDSGLLEPNAMNIATVDGDGQPSLRTVLLKYFDEKGLVFFTNLESRKAKDIGHNARVALHFLWIELERQVRVEGTAERVSAREAAAYFMRRPRGSQLGAWVSRQSSIISSRSLLEAKLEEMKRKFSEGEVPLPSFWGGYRVRPARFEFWQGRESRLHDRFEYRFQDDDTWVIERLAP